MSISQTATLDLSIQQIVSCCNVDNGCSNITVGCDGGLADDVSVCHGELFCLTRAFDEKTGC